MERGRIRFYGISSNTFPSPAADHEFTSLAQVWEIAQSFSPDHYFRVIQFAMNLLETGGVTERNQANGQSVLEFARSKKLGVLINLPLNAIAHNKILRLAEVGATRRVSDKDVTDLIDRLISSEKMLKDKILSRLGLPPAMQSQVVEQLATGAILKRSW